MSIFPCVDVRGRLAAIILRASDNVRNVLRHTRHRKFDRRFHEETSVTQAGGGSGPSRTRNSLFEERVSFVRINRYWFRSIGPKCHGWGRSRDCNALGCLPARTTAPSARDFLAPSCVHRPPENNRFAPNDIVRRERLRGLSKWNQGASRWPARHAIALAFPHKISNGI